LKKAKKRFINHGGEGIKKLKIRGFLAPKINFDVKMVDY